MNRKNNKKTIAVASTAAVTAAGLGVGGTLLAKKLFAGKGKRKADPQPAPENQDQVEATTPATEQEQPETNHDGDKK